MAFIVVFSNTLDWPSPKSFQTPEEFFLVQKSCMEFLQTGHAPRKPSLRLVCKTSNLNKNWKSQYFFLQGDDWICYPDDQEFMPVDKTWGIMPLSGRCLLVLNLILLLFVSCNVLIVFYCNFGSSKGYSRVVEFPGADL